MCFRSSRFESDVQVRPLSGDSLSEQRHMCEWCHGLLPLHLPFWLQGEWTSTTPHTAHPRLASFLSSCTRVLNIPMSYVHHYMQRASSSIFPSWTRCLWSFLISSYCTQAAVVCVVDTCSVVRPWRWGLGLLANALQEMWRMWAALRRQFILRQAAMRNDKCDQAGAYKNLIYAASITVHFRELEQIAL